MERSDSGGRATSNRRRFLGTTATVGGLALAGCLGLGGGGEDPFDDYGPQAAPVESTAVSWDDLGDLEGELTVYSGRRQVQIDPLFEDLEETYDGFTIERDYDDVDNQLATLREEGENSPADVYYTQSSAELATLKGDGLARELPEDVVDAVDENYRDPDGEWTGASGRVRAVQYNTDHYDADDLPEDVFAYAEDDRFEGVISTRPNSGTFRSFVVAMLEEAGEQRTREWLRGMVEDQNATLFSSGSDQAESVKNGEVHVGLGNQYYAGRILANEPDAPLGVTFTRDDPGCLFNVSGLAILEGADRPNLAAEFLRHVLAAEGQEFFVHTNGEYPVLDGVEYVGDLPALSDLEPMRFDLNVLGGRLEDAQELIREEGMRV